MTDTHKRRSRRQFLLVALVFSAPLLLASLLYTSGRWQPQGSTNHGAVLEPITNIDAELASSGLETERLWLMVYINDGPCDERCVKALLRIHQSRLMLGKEMYRVGRVFLHGAITVDTVFLQEHHAGLTTITNTGLLELLARKQPEQLQAGGIFLLDLLGNLIMYFSPDIEPGDMVDDIKHLLDLSRID